jgi:NMD protein affecting ribosome stability and mRNA decay
VYEGDFRETAKWMKDYETYTNRKNLKIEKTYMWYTTCPKCAKKYGKNYVAILGKIS